MAASYSIVKRMPDVGKTIVDVTADGSYPAGGYPVTAANVGMLNIDNIIGQDKTQQGNLIAYDPVNAKLKVYQTGAALSGVLSEAVSGDLSTSNVFRLEVTGTPVV